MNNGAAVENPHEFATAAVGIIKEKLTEQLVDGVPYEKAGEWYEMSQFELELETWSESLVKSERPDGSEGFVPLRRGVLGFGYHREALH